MAAVAQALKITDRWNGSTIFEGEAESLSALLQNAAATGADLTRAYLRGADLRDADLRRANLKCANLRGADLRGTDLTQIRDDLWAVLSAQPAEVLGLRKAIAEGRINGSTYHGTCCCLVGTLANVAHVAIESLPRLKMNSDRPIEQFFMSIKKGDTPESSQISALVLEWVDEWLAGVRAAIPALTA